MSRKPASFVQTACLFLAVGVLFISAGRAYAVKVENRLFMKQYAGFVLGMLDSEASVRARIRAYLKENKALVREGFGTHPDLIFRLDQELGLVRMNCIEGRYYDNLQLKLNNEERHIFYENAQRLNWWVAMVAEEEADRLGILKASPPLEFRLPSDRPSYIAKTMRDELTPFAQARLSPEDMKGLSYNALPCR